MLLWRLTVAQDAEALLEWVSAQRAQVATALKEGGGEARIKEVYQNGEPGKAKLKCVAFALPLPLPLHLLLPCLFFCPASASACRVLCLCV